MPITVVHIQYERYKKEQIEGFLNECCAFVAEALESPIDRIRIFANNIPAGYVSIGGKLASNSEKSAPFYETYLLEGRPARQREAVLKGIADLLAKHLNEDISSVRGICHMVPPEHWAIAGIPASGVRADEIAERRNKT